MQGEIPLALVVTAQSMDQTVEILCLVRSLQRVEAVVELETDPMDWVAVAEAVVETKMLLDLVVQALLFYPYLQPTIQE